MLILNSPGQVDFLATCPTARVVNKVIVKPRINEHSQANTLMLRHARIRARIHKHTQMHAHARIYTYANTITHTHTYMRARVHTLTYSCTHISAHKQTYPCSSNFSRLCLCSSKACTLLLHESRAHLTSAESSHTDTTLAQ